MALSCRPRLVPPSHPVVTRKRAFGRPVVRAAEDRQVRGEVADLRRRTIECEERLRELAAQQSAQANTLLTIALNLQSDTHRKTKEAEDRVRDTVFEFRKALYEHQSFLQDGLTAVSMELKDVKTTLQADLNDVRTELKDVKSELQAELKDVKTELQAELKGVKTELQADLKDFKTVMSNDLKAVKTELKCDIAVLNKSVEIVMTVLLVAFVVPLGVAFVQAFPLPLPAASGLTKVVGVVAVALLLICTVLLVKLHTRLSLQPATAV